MDSVKNKPLWSVLFPSQDDSRIRSGESFVEHCRWFGNKKEEETTTAVVLLYKGKRVKYVKAHPQDARREKKVVVTKVRPICARSNNSAFDWHGSGRGHNVMEQSYPTSQQADTLQK